MEYTEEQKIALEKVRKKWLNNFFGGEYYKNFDEEECRKSTKEVYKVAGFREPIVIIARSLPESQKIAKYLIDEERTKNLTTYESFAPYEHKDYSFLKDVELNEKIVIPFSSYANYTDFGWLAFYDFYKNNVDAKSFDPKIEEINTAVKYTCMSIQCEKVCIVVKYPKEVHVNENFVLHNPNGPAILFEDGYGQYYINGRFIPSTNFKEACSLEGFKESFMQIKNEDTKAGMLFVLRNKFGQEGVMKALGAVLFNEEVIAHKNGYLETVRLYHSTEKYSFLIDSKGNENNPYAWLEITCPSTGTKYLQNTFADFKTATEACKFHRPEGVPMDLIYMWNSAN